MAERSGANSRRDSGDLPPPSGRQPVEWVVLLVAAGLGALLFAGSLEEGGEDGWWGLPLGLVVAVASRLALGGLFDRARARLDAGARTLLPVLADFLSVVMALASLLFGLLGFAVFLLLLPLLRGGGGGGDEKYAGLRVLR